ncbi:hypothetical protein CROQUDRAFT_661779 [Cronartium quercuum f. sp. fusiforme G11]|uniref:Uncharacterized protein n=1 Tax=Cronartium quercuum f. sp. fusiforme G11 TaxID=708437 RepID=A0A9P6T8F0_9BASI|nr:hypothetical protein CROQUDRAFT_661779 [Cronartium quercuum f. sp. fusiforme G11]
MRFGGSPLCTILLLKLILCGCILGEYKGLGISVHIPAITGWEKIKVSSPLSTCQPIPGLEFLSDSDYDLEWDLDLEYFLGAPPPIPAKLFASSAPHLRVHWELLGTLVGLIFIFLG